MSRNRPLAIKFGLFPKTSADAVQKCDSRLITNAKSWILSREVMMS